MRGARTRGGSEVNEAWGVRKKKCGMWKWKDVSRCFKRWMGVEYEGVGCSVCGNEGGVKCVK